MAKPHVLFLHGLTRPTLDWVMAHLPDDFTLTAVSAAKPEAEILDAARVADFLMVYRADLTAGVVAAASNLRLVQLLAAGYDGVDLDVLRPRRIPCAQNAGANSFAVAEYALLLMLAVYRRLVLADRATRDGRWREPITGLNTYEMEGKLVGIFGIGNIGSKVAQRVQGFGARVQYYDKYPWPPERELKAGLTRVSLDELFRSSDILTIHAPLTPETHKLVNEDVLARMKPTAVVINTSRGEIIDERALLAALEQGRLAGAGLDVFEREPVDAQNPLLKLDTVVVSPHSAGTTVDTWQRRLDFAFGNMRRVAAGEPPLGLVTG